MLKRHKQGYSRVYNQAFNDFLKNIGFNNRLLVTQPDIIKDFEIIEFDLFPVRQELKRATVPTSEQDPLTLSYLAGE